MIKKSKYLRHFREPVMLGIRYGLMLKQALERQIFISGHSQFRWYRGSQTFRPKNQDERFYYLKSYSNKFPYYGNDIRILKGFREKGDKIININIQMQEAMNYERKYQH